MIFSIYRYIAIKNKLKNLDLLKNTYINMEYLSIGQVSDLNKSIIKLIDKIKFIDV